MDDYSQSFKNHVHLLQQYTGTSHGTAEYHLKWAVKANTQDEVLDHQFVDALWRLHLSEQNQPISRATLSVSLLQYYLNRLRRSPVQIPDAQAFGEQTNPLVFLDSFGPLGSESATAALGRHGYYSTRLQLVSGLPKDDADRLIRQHKFSVMNALRQASQGGMLTAKEADAAFLSELTDLNPVDARQAKGTLIDSIQEQRQHFTPIEYHTRLLTAKLIDFDVEAANIRQIVMDTVREEDGTLEEIWLTIRNRLCWKLFNMQTRTSRTETAEKALQEAGGDLKRAILLYNSRLHPVLAGIENKDTAGPPDVQPNTKVIGFLGTVDREAPFFTASQAVDGWFVSDFYLMKHMLAGMGDTQLWMTCLDPAVLVQKYCVEPATDQHGKPMQHMVELSLDEARLMQVSHGTGYVHGDPGLPRRVVLDKHTLSFAQQDFEICSEETLLQSCLERLETAMQAAAQENKPVLLLLFAHGDLRSDGGLQIGLYDPEDKPKELFLTADKVVKIHEMYPQVKLSIFMTSCYSGQWVHTPYFRNMETTKVMAATQRKDESNSCHQSHSMRYAGGLFSSGFKMELEAEPSSEQSWDGARSYTDFLQSCISTCEGLSSGTTTPSFVPEKNLEFFWQRTGYELNDYRANFERLKQIPASEPLIDSSQAGSLSTNNSRAGGFRSRTDSRTAVLLAKYRSHHPETSLKDRELAHIIHQYEAGLFADNPRSMEILSRQLSFRVGKDDFALVLAEAMGLKYIPAVNEYDYKQERENRGEAYRERHKDVWAKLVLDTTIKWFDPEAAQGRAHYRPYYYLAHIMTINEWDDEQVALGIGVAKMFIKLNGHVEAGSRRIRDGKSWSDAMGEVTTRPRPHLQNLSAKDIQWQPKDDPQEEMGPNIVTTDHVF